MDRKTERLLSLVIKTRVVQNVHRMSKIQSDRQEDIQFARQTDKVTERQNDSMADSRAAKEPALVFISMLKTHPHTFSLPLSLAISLSLFLTLTLFQSLIQSLSTC